MKTLFPAKIQKDKDGQFHVRFFDIDEATTQASTLDEALTNAEAILNSSLNARLNDDIEVNWPMISEGKDIYHIAPSAKIQSAMLIHYSRGERSKDNIAQKMGITVEALEALEKTLTSPTLDLMEKAANALGKRVVLNFEEIPEQ